MFHPLAAQAYAGPSAQRAENLSCSRWVGRNGARGVKPCYGSILFVRTSCRHRALMKTCPWGRLKGAAVRAASPNEGICKTTDIKTAIVERRKRERQLELLRTSLLAALSSLDRGLAANVREAADVDNLCSRIEALGVPVTLAPVDSVTGLAGARADLLGGTWRLIYSSGFNSGSLGGRLPGPPVALFPAVLGQVYQRIDPETAKLDNIVELLFNYGSLDWGLGDEALGRGLPGLVRQLGMEVKPEQLPPPLRSLFKETPPTQNVKEASRRASPGARLTLRHDYEVTSPAAVRIVYEETYIELVGNHLLAQLPRVGIPSLPEPLRPPKFLRSATFDVTFLDEIMRITRGDRGELRVYLRDTATIGDSGGSSFGDILLDYDD